MRNSLLLEIKFISGQYELVPFSSSQVASIAAFQQRAHATPNR